MKKKIEIKKIYYLLNNKYNKKKVNKKDGTSIR